MTKLEELKAAFDATWDTYLDARARADAGYAADVRAAYYASVAADAASAAYEAELKKTQKEKK